MFVLNILSRFENKINSIILRDTWHLKFNLLLDLLILKFVVSKIPLLSLLYVLQHLSIDNCTVNDYQILFFIYIINWLILINMNYHCTSTTVIHWHWQSTVFIIILSIRACGDNKFIIYHWLRQTLNSLHQ